MYLSKLNIKNFRGIASCEINFCPGLNIILGENNIGKSTVIDALRALVLPMEQQGVILSDLDIGVLSSDLPIELSYIFDGLTIEEEAIFIEALVKHNDIYQAHFHINLTLGKYGRRLKAQRWCGTHESEHIPSQMLEELVSIYLPPLRNPTEGLKPGNASQIARLVKCFSQESDEKSLENMVKGVDEALESDGPVAKASEKINKKIQDITGADMSQNVDISFAPANFKKILSRLALYVENMDVEQNGLGYNNVVYTAAVLSQLANENKAAYRTLLIEEPEAHLHPQLQMLLLRHLAAEANTAREEKNTSIQQGVQPVQVIVTSHSTIFASQAPLDTIINLHKCGSILNCVSISKLGLPQNIKKKLERFLDSTRAELFFAKKLIMVEGIAEALLLPILARKMGVELKEKSVSILNVQGLNFNAFLPLFSENGIKIPCAIITDHDPQKVDNNPCHPKLDEKVKPSPTVVTLKAKETALVKIFCAQKTFEYDLALYPSNLSIMLDAYEVCHPRIAKELKASFESITDPHIKTKCFFEKFQESKSSKGEFSQALADKLSNSISDFEIPKYIEDAIRHVLI